MSVSYGTYDCASKDCVLLYDFFSAGSYIGEPTTNLFKPSRETLIVSILLNISDKFSSKLFCGYKKALFFGKSQKYEPCI